MSVATWICFWIWLQLSTKSYAVFLPNSKKKSLNLSVAVLASPFKSGLNLFPCNCCSVLLDELLWPSGMRLEATKRRAYRMRVYCRRDWHFLTRRRRRSLLQVLSNHDTRQMLLKSNESIRRLHSSGGWRLLRRCGVFPGDCIAYACARCHASLLHVRTALILQNRSVHCSRMDCAVCTDFNIFPVYSNMKHAVTLCSVLYDV